MVNGLLTFLHVTAERRPPGSLSSPPRSGWVNSLWRRHSAFRAGGGGALSARSSCTFCCWPPWARGGLGTSLVSFCGMSTSSCRTCCSLDRLAIGCRLKSRPDGLLIDPSSKSDLAWRPIIRGLIIFVLLFPLSEPFGVCDVWPAWAVYASGPERARVYVDEADTRRLPAALRGRVDPPRFADGRCLVRIDRWSLDTTGARLYPQNRFRLGVGLALAQAAGLERSIHIELDGPANRWTGRRFSRTLTGIAELKAELDRYWLNGFPSPFTANAPIPDH